jgi:cobalt/nickel transport protein
MPLRFYTMKYKRGWIILAVLALLTPLGLLAVGSAWGEWDLETIKERIGFEPEGMKKTVESKPDAPIPDYEIPGLTDSAWELGLGTIISALLGAGLTVAIVLLITRVVKRGQIP